MSYNSRLTSELFAEDIADLAYRALIKEVELTPKPGLVDRFNNGAHKDMDIHTFYASAQAIQPWIKKFVSCGISNPTGLFDGLRALGIECERSMFLATKGINTHKGMIFSLAVICGAIGKLYALDKLDNYTVLQNEIKEICKDLVQTDLKNSAQVQTHGERFYAQTKCEGIRGEAMRGYPSIFDGSFPFFLEYKDNEDRALKLTLLFLMSTTQDSNVFARGGLEGLDFVKSEAKNYLHGKDLDKNLATLDKELTKRNLSCGGSADLLALTWFLAQLEFNN